MKIVFATNNQHKLQEIRDILGSDYEVVSLKEIGCDVDIPETGNTLEENALLKAQYVYDHYHVSCFAEYSASLPTEKQDVCPCGCTSIKKIHQFDGIVNGHIATEKHGTEGFGYDPIFVPEGYEKSFAELGEEIKNGISHRARAVGKLAEYLKKK